MKNLRIDSRVMPSISQASWEDMSARMSNILFAITKSSRFRFLSHIANTVKKDKKNHPGREICTEPNICFQFERITNFIKNIVSSFLKYNRKNKVLTNFMLTIIDRVKQFRNYFFIFFSISLDRRLDSFVFSTVIKK